MNMIKTSFFAVLLTSAAVSVPASAQVAGIATADTTDAIMTAKAFSQAYQQIGATFKSNGDLMNQKRREMNDINAQLDINKDKNLTQDELDAAIKAKNPLLTQLDAKEREIAQLQQPIVSAQAFALENIAAKYGAAQQAVVTAKKINLVISPDVVLYAPNTIDITAAIVTELDKIIPVAPITPPADWRPQGSTEPLYQQVQQRLMQAARIQAMRAQQVTQGGQPAVPGAAPAAPAPKAPDDGR